MRIFDAGQEAHGVIAVGQFATGFIAIGQVATGVIAVGQLARGVFAVGQLAVGAVTIGMVTVAPGATWALAGVALRGRGLAVWSLIPRPQTRSSSRVASVPVSQIIDGSSLDGWVDARLEQLPSGLEVAIGRTDAPVEFLNPEVAGAAKVLAANGPCNAAIHVRLDTRSRAPGDVGYRDVGSPVHVLSCDLVDPLPASPSRGPGVWLGLIARAIVLAALAAVFYFVAVVPVSDALVE